MEEWRLKVEPYGLNYRVNKAEQRELQRDPAWQVRLSRRFSETAAAGYPDEPDDDDGLPGS